MGKKIVNFCTFQAIRINLTEKCIKKLKPFNNNLNKDLVVQCSYYPNENSSTQKGASQREEGKDTEREEGRVILF